MEDYKKLSQYDIRTVLSMTDLFPTLVDNGDGTYSNKNVPLSAIRTYSAVPAGGVTNQVLQKTNNSDYNTQWHSLLKADVGLGNVDNTADVDKPVSTATTSAITAAIAAAKQALYPVGSIYVNASDSTNPGTLLGFGTWVAFGSGQVAVGFSSGDTDFGTIGQTGGVKSVTLTEAQIPSHRHTVEVYNGGAGVPEWATPDTTSVGGKAYPSPIASSNYTRGFSNYTGGGGSHTNLQPYITVYMWKRTA